MTDNSEKNFHLCSYFNYFLYYLIRHNSAWTSVTYGGFQYYVYRLFRLLKRGRVYNINILKITKKNEVDLGSLVVKDDICETKGIEFDPHRCI